MPNKAQLALLAWGGVLLLFLPLFDLLLLLSAILLHEGGHLLAFYVLGEPLPTLSAALAGLSLDPHRPLSYRHELVIAVAGPLANLALFAILLVSGRTELLPLAAVQLLAALSNLLPLGRSDGARILLCAASLLLPLRPAELVTRTLSLLVFCPLLFFLLYLLLLDGGDSALLLLLALLLRAARPL